MGIRTKFNLVLLLVFTVGLAVTGYVSYNLLQRNAQDEVLRNAGVIMEAALSMRKYTQKHVSPKLDYQPDTFLPESVPAFAATEMMGQLRGKYENYHYKEAALNPTNRVPVLFVLKLAFSNMIKINTLHAISKKLTIKTNS